MDSSNSPSNTSKSSFESRVRAVFDDAYEIKTADRPAFLDRACDGNSRLRARVEGLLRAADVDDTFLREPTPTTPPQSPAPTPEPDRLAVTAAGFTSSPGEMINSMLGPYKLLERIGSGGFGTVFLAEQTHPVSRRVAVKVITPGMDTAAVVARFDQERRALAMMDHPNIARVLDAGSTPAGRPYFAMDLVGGTGAAKARSITDFCDTERLTIEARIALLIHACDAVQHAHTKGIIHRDIKPGNVLVSRPEPPTTAAGARSGAAASDDPPAPPVTTAAAATLKVIDFGIAKATDQDGARLGIKTLEGQLLGTPLYMSPEQAGWRPGRPGPAPDVDTRTDVYSLGVLLYELLAGSPPCVDPTAPNPPRFEDISRFIREVDPPAPSTRIQTIGARAGDLAARRSTRPDRLAQLLRGDLDWIVMRAIEKDPARRYQSPGALAADLTRYLTGEAVLAAPPSAFYQARKFVARHRVPVAAGALVAAALLLGFVGTGIGLLKARAASAEALIQKSLAEASATEALRQKGLAETSAAESRAASVEALRQKAIAEKNAERARKNAEIFDSARKLMRGMLATADRGRQGGRTDITVREAMDAAARELQSNLGAYDPLIAAAVAQNIGDTYRELNLFEPAARMFTVQAQLIRDSEGAGSVEYADALNTLGGVQMKHGNYEEAGKNFDQAADIMRRLAPDAQGALSRNLAFAIDVDRAVLLTRTGRSADAERAFRELVARAETQPDLPDELRATAIMNLASVLFTKGEAAEAERLYQQRLRINAASGPESEADRLIGLHNLAALRFRAGDLPAAEDLTRQELALARKLYGESHTAVAAALEATSLIKAAQGDPAGAEEPQRAALAIHRSLLGPAHRSVATGLGNLGSLLLQRRDYAGAEEALSEACAILDKALAPGSRDRFYTRYQLCVVVFARSAFADIERDLRESLAASESEPMMREGARYEWMRHAAVSLLGAALAEQAAAPGTPPERRDALLAEADPLVTTSADRIVALASNMGPKTRATVVPAALERVIRFYQIRATLDPATDRSQTIAQWQARADAFKAAQVPPK